MLEMGLLASAELRHFVAIQCLNTQRTANPDHMLVPHPNKHIAAIHTTIDFHQNMHIAAVRCQCIRTTIDRMSDHHSHITIVTTRHWSSYYSITSRSSNYFLDILGCTLSQFRPDSGCSSSTTGLIHSNSIIGIGHPRFVVSFALASFIAGFAHSKFVVGFAHSSFVINSILASFAANSILASFTASFHCKFTADSTLASSAIGFHSNFIPGCPRYILVIANPIFTVHHNMPHCLWVDQLLEYYYCIAVLPNRTGNESFSEFQHFDLLPLSLLGDSFFLPLLFYSQRMKRKGLLYHRAFARKMATGKRMDRSRVLALEPQLILEAPKYQRSQMDHSHSYSIFLVQAAMLLVACFQYLQEGHQS